MNYSQHRIFKCIGFVPSHYVSTINLDVMSSFSIFSEFDYVSQSYIYIYIYIYIYYVSFKIIKYLIISYDT